MLILSVICIFSLEGNSKTHSIASIYTQISKKESNSNIGAKQAIQDGFLSGTLVKTLQGHKFIEHLKKYDVIIGTDSTGAQSEKTVFNVAQNTVEYYIRIKIGNEILDVAPNQRFYLPIEQCWVEARNLNPSMKLLTNSPTYNTPDSIERIHQNTQVYEINVDGHTFFVTPFEILAHNSDAIAISAPLLIGCITALNPVTASIGVGIGLGVSGTLLYNEYKRHISQYPALTKTTPLSPQQEQLSQKLPERLYYQTRLQALIKIRQDFLTVKQDLEKISQIFSGNPTYHILQLKTQEIHTKFCPQPTIEQEIALCPEQVEKLRDLRQFDLNTLEQQIEDLQITLAFHVDKVIEQRKSLIDEYGALRDKLFEISDSAERVDNFPPQKLELYYKTLIELEECAQNIKDKNYELKLIAQYYTTPQHAQILKDSTDIRQILDAFKNSVQEWEVICNHVSGIDFANFKNIVESCIREGGINPFYIREQTKENLKQQKNTKQVNAFEAAKNKRTTYQYPKPPKKDDDKDKKNEKLDAQAPGMPTEKDGYRPPKRWNGEKVRHSKTGQIGYPDEKGDIWVPSGPGGHGGPHWDVVNPKGDYRNILPGGKERGAK
jgi:hypothetical protein